MDFGEGKGQGCKSCGNRESFRLIASPHTTMVVRLHKDSQHATQGKIQEHYSNSKVLN